MRDREIGLKFECLRCLRTDHEKEVKQGLGVVRDDHQRNKIECIIFTEGEKNALSLKVGRKRKESMVNRKCDIEWPK